MSVAAARAIRKENGPIPRRQNLPTAAVDLPQGPSVLDAGVMPSQLPPLSQNLPAPSQAAAAARPRVLRPAEVDEALRSIERVTKDNAWSVPLLVGENVNVSMGAGGDHFAQFSRAATLVDGSSRVWAHRVDSTHALSTQMLGRLRRNEGREAKDASQGGGAKAAERRAKRHALQRTLADTVDEVNQEGASLAAAGTRGLRVTYGAMFAAMTQKFDQGYRGLLLHNAPVGRSGVPILDRDFVSDHDANTRAAQDAGEMAMVQLPAVESDNAPRVSAGGALPSAPDVPPRAPTVASQPANFDDFDGESDFGGLDFGGFDDDGGGDDDTAMGMRALSRAASVARSQRGPSVSHLQRMSATSAGGANASGAAGVLLSGVSGLEAIHDALAQQGGGDDGNWLPLSQAARFGADATSGGLLSQLRRSAAVGADAAASAPTRRRQAGADATLDVAVLRDRNNSLLMSKLKPGRDVQVLDTPASLQQYKSVTYQMERARAQRLLLPSTQEALPWWASTATTRDIASYYQPFVAPLAAGWNLLRKRHLVVGHAAAATASGGTSPTTQEPGQDPPPSDVLPDIEADFGGFDIPDDDHDDFPAAATTAWAAPEETEAAAAAATSAAASEAVTTDMLKLIAPAAAVDVGAFTIAVAPVQVDVVRLRERMWWHLQHAAAAETAAKHADAIESHMEGPAGGRRPRSGGQARAVLFTQVVQALLPEVPRFCRGGALAPAFFFFALLFLANEHSLLVIPAVEGDTRCEDVLVVLGV